MHHHFHPHTHDSSHLFVHLDARVKLLSALVLLVMVISCRGAVFPLLVAGLCVIYCVSMGVRLKALAMRYAEPLFIAVTMLLLKLFFAGKAPLFSWHIFGVHLVGHSDGLMEGLRIASRIGGAVSIVALLGFSTPFTDLMAALAWLRVPRGLIEVALFAWRYLFVLFDDAQVVYCAQKNRLGYAGYRQGLRSFGTLAGTLVIKAFDNSQTVTTAMVQRGYDGKLPFMRHRPFRFMEVAAAVLFVAIMGVAWSF